MRRRSAIHLFAAIYVARNGLVQLGIIGQGNAERIYSTPDCTHDLADMLTDDHVANADFAQLPIHIVHQNFGQMSHILRLRCVPF